MIVDLKTGNWWSVVVAIVVGTALIMWQLSHYESNRIREEQRRAAEPAETWFVVRNVAVPDFIEGDDPLITYDREIRRNFKAAWTAEFYAVDSPTKFPICSGAGSNSYKTTDVLPVTGVELSWFVGVKCDLSPGAYFLETDWTLEIPGYPDKTTRFVSNPFRVVPRGGQIYITPEQVQKLREQ